MNLIENRTKYGLIKAASFVTKWLEDNNTEMYLIHNEEKSVNAERFIKTLKTRIYKYMTSISKKWMKNN